MPQKLAAKLGVSKERLSSKIAKVHRDDPRLTNRQAAGKAAGILAGQRRKKRRRSGASRLAALGGEQ